MNIDIIAFVNLFTLLLFLCKITFGWPGTWLLVFTPLIVWWSLCMILLALSLIVIATIALRR